MPRSRGTEMPQRQSPRAPLHLRTTTSDSDLPHHRSADRPTRLSDGRSPRGSHSEPMNQKKLGTRIADLESQLGQAQDELKNLKDQLASTEAAKKAAQEQLEKKPKKQQTVDKPTDNVVPNKKESAVLEQETDVFEVPVEKATVESKPEPSIHAAKDELKSKLSQGEPEKPSVDEVSLKNIEINTLKTKLEEKEKELDVFQQENVRLKIEVNEKLIELSSAQSKGEEMTFKLNQTEQELEKSKNEVLELNEKLETTERAKVELEGEMKKLHIHTEQWRKAADAAASVLAGGAEINGRRLSERCGSMDKHYGNVFEPVGGYAGYVGSPGMMDEGEDDFGSGKKKGSGIKMFGDLWKRKGHKY